MASVLVGMSGGVDSSVAAALLVEAGHDVVGVTMKLWGGDSDTGCCSVSDVEDARRVAQQLGIDHLVFNFTDDFDRHVVQPYVQAHIDGHTPNPCIECNRHLKFERLSTRAKLLGFDAVATGHHARVVADPSGQLRLARGADPAKDQSYVVHMIDGPGLEHSMFPVGHLHKSDVRAQAVRLGLRTASKPDSQDVCFITRSSGRAAFLGHRIPLRPGRVVDTAGVQVGSVDAIELVTIGQRKGLGLPGGGNPMYTLGVDIASATVTVGSPEELVRSGVVLVQMSWTHAAQEGTVKAQVSAHGVAQAAYARVTGEVVVVEWHVPQRQVAPGQSVVLYDETDTYVLGGGIASSISATPAAISPNT